MASEKPAHHGKPSSGGHIWTTETANYTMCAAVDSISLDVYQSELGDTVVYSTPPDGELYKSL